MKEAVCIIFFAFFVPQVQMKPLEERKFPCSPYRMCIYPRQYCDGEICVSCSSSCGRAESRIPSACLDFCLSKRTGKAENSGIATSITTANTATITMIETTTGQQREERGPWDEPIFYVVILVIPIVVVTIIGCVCKGYNIRNGINLIKQTLHQHHADHAEEIPMNRTNVNPEEEGRARCLLSERSPAIDDYMADKAS